MSNPYYRASVEVFLQRLDGLAHVLDKAIEFAAGRNMSDEQLLGARIHADMLPLIAQIRIATDFSKSGAARLAGVEPPAFEDNETTAADAKARITKTKAFLDTLTPAQFEGAEDRRVQFKLRDDQLDFTAPAYLHHFSMPNFYFHVVTAFDIIRSMGVPIGKYDFFAHQMITE